MKIETWKPLPPSATRKDGVFADEMVTFYPVDAEPTRIQFAPALLLALDFLASRRAFRIEDELLNTWLSYDGVDVRGTESVQQALADMAPIVDVMFNHYFNKRMQEMWERGQARLAEQQAQAVAEAEAAQEVSFNAEEAPQAPPSNSHSDAQA